MATANVHLAMYRRLVRLYPPSFRHSYGEDLVALFENQMRDESPVRVWARTFRDLVISVPGQRLEAHMNGPSSRLVTLVSAVVAGTAALLGLLVGSGPALPVFLIVALLSTALSVWTWQASQPVRADNTKWTSGSRLLLAGPALAALTIVGMLIPWPDVFDLGDGAYWLIVIAFGTSVTLATGGVLLGIGAIIEHRRTKRSGPSPA